MRALDIEDNIEHRHSQIDFISFADNVAHIMKSILLAVLAGAFACSWAVGAETYVPFEGEKTTWHDDFERFDYVMDEESFAITPFKRPATEKFAVGNPPKGQRRCIVVVPKKAARGNPWSWQGCYWNHEPQTEVELLRRGFHIAFITPDPGKQWDAFHSWLTEKHGLAKKPAFVGMSRGGINEYDWTTANPEKVSCIYADNPAIRRDALAKLDLLAKHDVALLNVCGSADSLLPRNTLLIEARYLQLDGEITLMIKDGPAHHPHSLKNAKPIADWIEQHMMLTPRERPAFAGEKFIKSYYYSLASTNVWLPEEKTWANCRGPGFVESYERYDEGTSSQWGVTGMTVIVPKTVAPGKPWVFRADAITRDATTDQALLARGFHIVIPALTAQSGAVRTQWNNAYGLMTSHGFSRKPVLEGTATAAGECYAWASENADKVACIVGHNAALRSLMSKTSPFEALAPLAKAGVPLIHISDRNDHWFKEHTRVAEQSYKTLGGQMTVVKLEDAEPTRVVELIRAAVK